MKQQTVVDYLLSRLSAMGLIEDIDDPLVEQIRNEARQTEKEQAIRFHIECMKAGLNKDAEKKWDEYYAPIVKSTAEKHYSENYENPNT